MRLNSTISSVPMDRILSRLVHPSVFHLLGLSCPLATVEAEDTGDLLKYTYEGKHGKVLVSNDGVRILIEAWYRDEKVLMCAVRDRQLDGTEQTSPLTFYPNTDPACNRLPGPGFKACELSIYSMDPATVLDGLDMVGTIGNFIADPDYYVWKKFDPQVFFPLWKQAFYIGRGPWQTARPMKGVPQYFVENAIELLRELGYHRVDAVPSWFNVARFFEKYGFTFTYGEHELMYRALLEGLSNFSSKTENRSLSRPQEAWLVVLQNIPESLIPDELKLPVRWAVTHTNTYWVRMHLELNHYTYTAPAATSDPGSVSLMESITGLRNGDCEDTVQVTISSRRHCPCTSSLGASSPGATSPSATDHKS